MERFDAYVERCLYDPTAGFYASGRGIAGRRRGDFITSPEVGPLFGAVVAQVIDRWWDELGRPDPYVVVDAGAGPGSLLRSVERASPRCLAAWVPIEVDRATGTTLPSDLSGAVVLANELLDNVAFRVAVRADGEWFEAYVEQGSEVLGPTDLGARCRALHPTAVDGDRLPIVAAAAGFVRDLLARGAVRVLAFDYGALTTSELATRGGWLRTYRAHERGDDPYREPGQWDITTDVPVDQLPEPTRVMTQARFLVDAGIDDLVAEGAAYWREHAAAPDIQALLMRSRVVESEALLDPTGLGGWLALQWGSQV
ncbi:MAG: SAM-dependent methyltransferase [Acidimicrobiales bacterium]